MEIIDAHLSTRRSFGIDMLRGILALWVLFSHLVAWTIITQGNQAIPVFLHWIMRLSIKVFQANGETNPAVLGFIVLSGYCIHRNGLRRTNNNINVYFIRRFFRIYPIYLLAVLWGVFCFTISLTMVPDMTQTLSGTNHLSLGYIMAKLVGISDIIPSMHTYTFQGNAPLHTVMVEIWLYVLYPILIVLIAQKYSERLMWILIIVVWGLGVLLISINPNLSGWWNNGSILGFLLYWWIGAKFVDTDFFPKIFKYRYVMLLAWFLSITIHIPFIVELRKVIFALLFGIIITLCDKHATRWRFGFDKIGKAGYSVYALHAPLVYTLLIFGIPWYVVALSAVTLGLIIFKIYENPFNQLGRNIAVNRRIMPS